MRKLTPENITPGMMLAVTVKDPQGNILFLKGIELTERHISIMQGRKVKNVIVEGSADDNPDKEKQNQLIDLRFSTAGSHPFMVKLRDMIKEFV
ncbi:MAG: hypothetical protein LLF86_03785 [Nitrospiraceae bacterium]|nr:hypothetical protein [Nitrospiraceae bacterium]